MANPKVIITTDLGGSDNDDAQSMIHALLYSNDVDYRGFVMTRTLDNGITNGARTYGESMLGEMIDAYAADLSNLRSHDSGYASASYLRDNIYSGSTNSTFPGSLSEGARHIIEEARATTASDPIYLLGWGPIHDIAAALRAAPDIVDNVRVFSLAGYGQDTLHTEAYDWMMDAVANDPAYHDLWWIDSADTMRGMYISSGGDRYVGIRQGLDWIKANVEGKGNLGELYWDEYTYNISVTRPDSVSPDGLKMGDTPSLLYLLDTVNNDNPLASSWGGAFVDSGLGTQTWVDDPDPALNMGGHVGARTVYEHRTAVRNDFAERLDWADTAAPTTPSKPVTGPSFGTGRVEVENLALDGYYVSSKAWTNVSGKIVEVSTKAGPQSGTVEGTFTGASGDYTITVRFQNENDGASPYQFRVDGALAFSWTGAGGDNSFQSISRNVHLDKSDVIEITGAKEQTEFARLDYFNIASASTGTGGGGGSDGPVIALGRTEAESLDLDGYFVSDKAFSGASGKVIQTLSSTGTAGGTAEGVFNGATGTYAVTVRFLNENDGVSKYRLAVDDELRFSWDGAGGNGSFESFTRNVELENGSLIGLTGVRDAGEVARIDYIEIATTSAAADDFSFA